MMSKTHLSIGMATALALCPITGLNSCLLALAGGALGGVIPDVDILDNDYKNDALNGELAAFGTLAFAVVVNFLTGGNIISTVLAYKWSAIVGAVAFIILWIKGYHCPHRGFTHSLLSMVLFTISIGLIYSPISIPFLFGYFSHLMLDILNKKKIRLLFPFKGGVCLNLCYANKKANTVFMVGGFVATAILLAFHLIRRY